MTPIYKEIALSYSFPSLGQKDSQAAVVWLLKFIVSGASEYVHSQIWPDLFLLPGEGNGTPLQYCCLENPMDGGAWWAAVHGVAKSQTRLSNFTFTFNFPPLEKEMATHSSILAWRIPGMREPGGLPSWLKRLSRSSFLLPSYEPTIWVKGLDYLLGPETPINTTVNIWLWFLVYYFWLELLSKHTKVKLLYPVARPDPYPLDSLLRLVITTKWWIGITLFLLQGKIYREIDRQT